MPETTEANTQSLVRKLRLGPTTRTFALRAPESYVARLRAADGAGAVETDAPQASGTFDSVHLFVRTVAEAHEWLPRAMESVRPGGILWVMWPKRSAGAETDLTRDTLWPIAASLGWGPVSNVAVDETWSALRFRPAPQSAGSAQEGH